MTLGTSHYLDGESGESLNDSVRICLEESKKLDRVVGIFMKAPEDLMHLTAVEKIVDGGSSGNTLVTLKKIDLQGYFITKHIIALSDVEKVRLFGARYQDRLPASLNTIAARLNQEFSSGTYTDEVEITKNDVAPLIIMQIGSDKSAAMRFTEVKGTSEVFIRGITGNLENVVLSTGNESSKVEIPLSIIERLELKTPLFGFI